MDTHDKAQTEETEPLGGTVRGPLVQGDKFAFDCWRDRLKEGWVSIDVKTLDNKNKPFTRSLKIRPRDFHGAEIASGSSDDYYLTVHCTGLSTPFKVRVPTYELAEQCSDAVITAFDTAPKRVVRKKS